MTVSGEQLIKLEELFLAVSEEEYEKVEGWYEPQGRGGIFGNALTIWLWTLQAITGGTLANAVAQLKEGACDQVLSRNRLGARISRFDIASSTGGYSRARHRIPEVDVEDATELLNESVCKALSCEDGDRTYFLDGTFVTLARTSEIKKEYKQPTGAYGKRNHPLMRVVFATESKSGVATKPSFGSHKISEQRLSVAVLDSLEKGALVVADRNFGCFPVISHATQVGKNVLMRLSTKQAHKFLQGEKAKGAIDKEVVWNKSYRDKLLDANDPCSLSGRFIRVELKYEGFRPLTLLLFTTSNKSAEELAELYGRRVDIETDIRQLKSLFAMEELLVKSPEMARKHLLILFASHNLLRGVIAQAARALKIPPRKISFKNAVMYIRIFGKQMQKTDNADKQKELYAHFLKTLNQCKLPNRKKRRSEPRMLTRRRSAFPLMRGTRKQVKKRLGIA